MKQMMKMIIPVLIIVALLYCFAVSVDNINKGRRDEQLQQVEQAVRRTCVACYASEGIYPPSIDYMREHYGLQIDEDNYTVHYVAFAQNLMPDITILPVS